MQEDIDRVLISQTRIAKRVRQLARAIIDDAGGDEITILPILTGAMIFCGDLIRCMPVRMKIGLITVSSYPGKTIRSAAAQILSQQVGDIRDRHVLLVDDILDSGNTVRLVAPLLQSLGPATVRTCVLLRKDRPSARDVHVDYVGFEIPDEFVVGYGLDYDDYYRNLPDIVTLKRDVIEQMRPSESSS